MRGTLMAREIVAKARMPSGRSVSTNPRRCQFIGERTHRSNNLRLQAKLVLEPSREITHASLAVGYHIRHLPDVVEHVPAREQQDAYQAYGGPEVAVLDYGEDVRCGDAEEGDGA